jgi:hypothetical protein
MGNGLCALMRTLLALTVMMLHCQPHKDMLLPYMVPPKNRYVPLFGINLRRPITPAVRALLTQLLNLILINDVNNAIHALRNVLVRQQRSFFFVIVLYFSRIVVQTHTIIIYRYVIKMYVYMCDFFGIFFFSRSCHFATTALTSFFITAIATH